jgi:hypothetical protein
MKEKKITATFQDDTKRFHKFVVDDGQDIKGTFYLPKDREVPDVFIVRFRTRAEAEAEKKG